MNRMAGILLMTIGVMSFMSGLYLFKNSSKDKNEVVATKISGKSVDSIAEPTTMVMEVEKDASSPIEQKVDKQPLHSLERAIEMAIADGVLTGNEKKVIKQIAKESNLDYDSVIKDVEARISALDIDSETELIDINKKNGNDFEKFVVQKFNKNFFEVKEWAGDKFVNGRYAQTTLQPDLLMQFKLGNKTDEFSVECKWRREFHKSGGIAVATDEQIDRYKKFERERGVPVFITIGIGGKASSPENLFIVPLQNLETGFISASALYKHKKNVEKDFYYDEKSKVLK